MPRLPPRPKTPRGAGDSADPGLPPKKTLQEYVPKETLEEFEKTAEVWVRDPKALRQYIHKQVLVNMQVANYVAHNPPPSRSGYIIASRALAEFGRMAADVMDAVVAQETADRAERERLEKMKAGGKK